MPQRYDPDHLSGASFRTWLYQIARNCFQDRRKPTLLFPDIQPSDSDSGGEASDPTALQRDFDFNRSPTLDEAVAREHRASIHDCREGLPAREKLAIIVWLREEGARGVGNILAAELRTQFPGRGASAATASTLLNEAFNHMRECLERKGVTANL
jgi:DNA-directed RNA polymerase specialized sigma24 family protein